jgi:hypothetical protein
MSDQATRIYDGGTIRLIVSGFCSMAFKFVGTLSKVRLLTSQDFLGSHQSSKYSFTIL